MNILSRILNPEPKKVEKKEPVIVDNVTAAPPPDEALEEKSRRLQRDLAHGFMVMDQSVALARKQLAIAALQQMDRSR